MQRRCTPSAIEMAPTILFHDFTDSKTHRHHPEQTNWSLLCYNTGAQLQPVQLFLPPRSRDQTSERQTDQQMKQHHFPFPLVISVTFRPAAADCSCHTIVTVARSACEFRGVKVTSWILLWHCTSDTWNHPSCTCCSMVCVANHLIYSLISFCPYCHLLHPLS